MKFDVVGLKFVSYLFLISLCKESLHAKMEKLEAQILHVDVQDRALKLCPGYLTTLEEN